MIGYVISAAIAATIGVIVSYFVVTASGDEYSFNFWLTHQTTEVMTGLLVGALIGLGSRYLMVSR